MTSTSTSRMVMLAAWFQLLAFAPAAWAAQPANTAAPPAATTAAPAKPDAKPLPPTMPGGYRLRNIRGEMVYCRTVVPTGTTLPKTECLTPEAVAEMQKVGQRQSDSLSKQVALCASSVQGGGCFSN